MSHRYYSTRLFFVGGTGIAKLHGRFEILFKLPDIFDSTVSGVDYAPEAGYGQLVRNGVTCDMTKEEISAADRYLVKTLDL